MVFQSTHWNFGVLSTWFDSTVCFICLEQCWRLFQKTLFQFKLKEAKRNSNDIKYYVLFQFTHWCCCSTNCWFAVNRLVQSPSRLNMCSPSYRLWNSVFVQVLWGVTQAGTIVWLYVRWIMKHYLSGCYLLLSAFLRSIHRWRWSLSLNLLNYTSDDVALGSFIILRTRLSCLQGFNLLMYWFTWGAR